MVHTYPTTSGKNSELDSSMASMEAEETSDLTAHSVSFSNSSGQQLLDNDGPFGASLDLVRHGFVSDAEGSEERETHSSIFESEDLHESFDESFMLEESFAVEDIGGCGEKNWYFGSYDDNCSEERAFPVIRTVKQRRGYLPATAAIVEEEGLECDDKRKEFNEGHNWSYNNNAYQSVTNEILKTTARLPNSTGSLQR
jgi:hypothetical protein